MSILTETQKDEQLFNRLVENSPYSEDCENIINDVSDYFAVLKHLTEKTETTVNNSKMLTITLRLLKTKMQGIVDKTYGIITKISETYNNVSVEKFMNNDFN